MKTFISDLIPKIRRFSEKLDNITLLTNKHWVVIDELKSIKYVYIFRSNHTQDAPKRFELLISQNGKVTKGTWEYIGNNSLLIERENESYLFRHGFIDSNVLALKVDGTEEYAFLVNEKDYEQNLDTLSHVISFLELRYLSPTKSHYGTNTIELDSENQLNLTRNEEGKFGFKNKLGELIIKNNYDAAYNFSEGLARVCKIFNENYLYGYIDANGNELIPMIYKFAEDFSNGYGLVRLENKFGYINKIGAIKIGFNFDDASSFVNGTAQVRIGSKVFEIDLEGKEIK